MFLSLNAGQMITICLLLCASYKWQGELRGPQHYFFQLFSSTVCSPGPECSSAQRDGYVPLKTVLQQSTVCRRPSCQDHKKTFLLCQRNILYIGQPNLLFPWVTQKLPLNLKFSAMEFALSSFHRLLLTLWITLEIQALKCCIWKTSFIVMK